MTREQRKRTFTLQNWEYSVSRGVMVLIGERGEGSMLSAAATAWVLWMEIAFSGDYANPRWSVQEAFPTHAACQERQTIQLLEEIGKERGKGVSLMESYGQGNQKLRFRMPDGTTAVIRLVCLPDTVDPRRPKP